jgi:hypothetical protein
MRVMNTLQDGIRMVWPYTDEHKLARELFEVYLSGDLKLWDEPRELLEGALERFKAKGKSKASKAAGQARKRRNPALPKPEGDCFKWNSSQESW